MVLVILTLDFMDERLLFYAPLESINAQGARKKGAMWFWRALLL